MVVFVRNQKELKFDVDGNLNLNVVAINREFSVVFSKNNRDLCAELLPNDVIENQEELTELNFDLFEDSSWRFFCNSIGSAINCLLTKGKAETVPFYQTKYTYEEGNNPQVYLKLVVGYFKNSKDGMKFIPL